VILTRKCYFIGVTIARSGAALEGIADAEVIMQISPGVRRAKVLGRSVGEWGREIYQKTK